MSQSLFQQMVFCNADYFGVPMNRQTITILILVDGFLQYNKKEEIYSSKVSQSLFQQMVFCNQGIFFPLWLLTYYHNPYFSRWFSAILKGVNNGQSIKASQSLFQQMVFCNSIDGHFEENDSMITILILVDGFLQYNFDKNQYTLSYITILILVDGFLQ